MYSDLILFFLLHSKFIAHQKKTQSLLVFKTYVFSK